ncbi:hypothetical protein ABPG74_011908 [Tetrahymena malaccensis]
MSACLNFVRFYLVLGAIFNILIGVACFVIATYVKNLNNDLLVIDRIKSSQKSIYIIMYIVGGLSVISSITAIYGFFKHNKFLQAKFIFLNVIYFLFFGAAFAFYVYGKTYIDDQLSLNNCTIGPLKSANDLFTNAQKLWCQTLIVSGQTVGCPCNITDKTQWSATDQAKLLTYNGISSTGTINIEQCQQFQSEISNYTSEANFLKLIETTFDCTGVCTGDIIYYFSDINRGPTGTAQGCYPQIRIKIYDWLKLIYIYTIIAAGITLANVIFAFIHCCIGNKQQSKDDYSKVHTS